MKALSNSNKDSDVRVLRWLSPRVGVGWTAAKLTFEHALFLARAAEEKMRFLSFESFSTGKPACQTEYRTSL